MYAKISNGAVETYPYSYQQLRLDNPNVSFPAQPDLAVMADFGVYDVVDLGAPVVDYTKNLNEGEPVEIDGIWYRNWIVSDASEQEIADRTEVQWASVRKERNSKLSACDWTQLPDTPLTAQEVADWAAYRQSLRDVTLQADPFNITWAVEPQ